MWQPMSPERAGAEVAPAAPAHGGVGRVVGPLVDRPEPEVPVERRGDRRASPLGRPIPCFQSRPGAVGPDVDLAHLADDAGLDPLVGQPGALGGVPLVAHLGHDAGGLARPWSARGIRAACASAASGSRRACPRGSPPSRRRRGCGRACRPSRRRCSSPPCRSSRGNPCTARALGNGLERAGGALVVDVAEGDDVRAVLGVGGDVAAPHAAGADPRDVHPLARRDVTRPAQHVARDDREAQRRAAGRGQERPPRGTVPESASAPWIMAAAPSSVSSLPRHVVASSISPAFSATGRCAGPGGHPVHGLE